jgi:TRAP-type C4-dicarboxylate transport system permease small subunit
MKTVNLAGTTVATGFPIWVIAIAILIGCVVVIVALVLKRTDEQRRGMVGKRET